MCWLGFPRADDAGVYKVSDDLALIQTVDFFTPVVDDPYWFGQIAAANALSDVYAMGGEPKTAMNLVGFPLKQMDLSVLRQVIQGGIDKVREAGVVLLGGHSVEDEELKYGLSVTGFIHPNRILTKQGLNVGDRLVLTKPLGTGIVNTAIKGNLASGEITRKVTAIMAPEPDCRRGDAGVSGACVHRYHRLRANRASGGDDRGNRPGLEDCPGKITHHRCGPGLCIHGHGAGRCPQKPQLPRIHGGYG
jgi:selenium donor protein